MYDQSNEKVFCKYELILKIWFIIFTLLNLFNIVIFGIYSGYSMIIPLLLPFVHTFVATILILVLSIRNAILKKRNVDYEYIKDQYPEVWKMMKPWGEHSNNSFAFQKFLFGGFIKKGEDEIIDRIRLRMHKVNLALIFPFALTAVIWIATFIVAIGTGK